MGFFFRNGGSIFYKLQGDFFLLEFFVKNISAQRPVSVTENGHSVVTILIEFHRELGNMVKYYD